MGNWSKVEAGAFANVNPAAEELLGEVSDASREDMAAAIDAARDAFDSADRSTNHVLRQRCLIQLQDALEQDGKSCARSSSARWVPPVDHVRAATRCTIGGCLALSRLTDRHLSVGVFAR